MKRPAVLIVGAVTGALLVAAIGASAHTGFVGKLAGVHSAFAGDEASGARHEASDTRVETPEPTDTPEAQKAPEPTETPEAADTDTETNDNNDNETKTTAATASGDHETGDHPGDHKNGSGGGPGD